MANEDFSAEFITQLREDQPLAWRLAFQALYPVAWHGAGSARWRLAEEDREEVASEALAEVARQVAALDTWKQISALTFVIARRRSISRLRALLAQKRGARVHATVSIEEIGEIELATENLPHASELAEAVAALVQKLGEPAATLVREHVHEGITHEELARRHGKPIGTIGVILYRAMHQLRRDVGRTPKFMKELQLYLRLLVVA